MTILACILWCTGKLFALFLSCTVFPIEFEAASYEIFPDTEISLCVTVEGVVGMPRNLSVQVVALLDSDIANGALVLAMHHFNGTREGLTHVNCCTKLKFLSHAPCTL